MSKKMSADQLERTTVKITHTFLSLASNYDNKKKQSFKNLIDSVAKSTDLDGKQIKPLLKFLVSNLDGFVVKQGKHGGFGRIAAFPEPKAPSKPRTKILPPNSNVQAERLDSVTNNEYHSENDEMSEETEEDEDF